MTDLNSIEADAVLTEEAPATFELTLPTACTSAPAMPPPLRGDDMHTPTGEREDDGAKTPDWLSEAVQDAKDVAQSDEHGQEEQPSRAETPQDELEQPPSRAETPQDDPDGRPSRAETPRWLKAASEDLGPDFQPTQDEPSPMSARLSRELSPFPSSSLDGVVKMPKALRASPASGISLVPSPQPPGQPSSGLSGRLSRVLGVDGRNRQTLILGGMMVLMLLIQLSLIGLIAGGGSSGLVTPARPPSFLGQMQSPPGATCASDASSAECAAEGLDADGLRAALTQVRGATPMLPGAGLPGLRLPLLVRVGVLLLPGLRLPLLGYDPTLPRHAP